MRGALALFFTVLCVLALFPFVTAEAAACWCYPDSPYQPPTPGLVNCWTAWVGGCSNGAANCGSVNGVPVQICNGDPSACFANLYTPGPKCLLRHDLINGVWYTSWFCDWYAQPAPGANRCTPSTAVYTPEQKTAFTSAGNVLTSTAAATTALAFTIPYLPVKKALQVAALAQAAGAAFWKILADDPSDPNYTVYAPVLDDPWDAIPADPLISVDQVTTLNAWLKNSAVMNALMRAMGQTLDKAQGATDAGNTLWIGRQISYYTMLKLQLAERTNDDIALRHAFALLPHGQFPSEFYAQLLNQGLLTALFHSSLVLKGSPLPGPVQGDLDGSGTADIVYRHASTGQVSVWLLQGATQIGGGSPGTVATDWTLEAVADFDGDGTSDLLWRHTSGLMTIWFMSGTQMIAQASPGTVATSWTLEGTPDLNGDGKADLVWRNSAGTTTAWLMNGAKVLSSGTIGTVATTWMPLFGDLTGDGKGDILWRHTGGDLTLWTMNGLSVTAMTFLANVPNPWHPVAVADFNADGKADILWMNGSGTLSLWLMNGATPLSNTYVFTVGAGWALAQVGDTDGDGQADVLWRGPMGELVLWRMHGPAILSQTYLGTVDPAWMVQP